ncbi:MAG: hypothetical protein ACTHNY_03850, partial [Solirubrobacterales bacterium]
MNIGSGYGRVVIVVRPLDRTLNFLRFLLVPVLVLAAGLPVTRALFESSQAGFAWAMLLLFVLAACAYFVVLQLDTIRSRLDEVFAQLRRQVALACNHDEVQLAKRIGAACRLTPQVFRVPLFEYDDQTTAVSALVEACESDQAGTYWFVEGESGSGKTRTAFRLIQTLARDRRLCTLANRCFFYDLGEAEFIQDELLDRLRTPRHDGAVVFVDNFQLVRADVLSKLTSRLLNRIEDPPEQLLVFLSRPGDAWNLSPRSDVRLLSEAKAANRYFSLDGASTGIVTRFVSEFDRRASEMLRNLEHERVASAAQLHLAQVIARHRTAPAEAVAMMSLLEGEADPAVFPSLSRVLAVTAALSVHRGTFSRREVRRALRKANREPLGLSRLRSAARARLTFWRLRRTGLVPKLNAGGSRYLFHEAIAELCIDRLSHDAAFEEPFVAAGGGRLKEQLRKGNDLNAWLIAAEVGETEVLLRNFDAALGRGAYQRMARCLKRARSRYEMLPESYELPPEIRVQLAIQLDRTGSFKESRAEFTDAVLPDLDESEELGLILTASRIEASHDRASEADIEVLRRSPDRLTAIIGEYWKLHIAAHRGRFDSSGMLELAHEALGLIEGRQSQHWLTYALGRVHFDSLRHHYLQGGTPTSEIGSDARYALESYLSDRMPTYKAMQVLYGRAHLVGHVFLPGLAIFARPVAAEERALAELPASDVSTVNDLADTALRLYRRAREEFWQYGDREAEYLQAEVMNAEMIQAEADLDLFPVRLNAYKEFIAETGFKDLYSYPHFYLFRWCMLKHYQQVFHPTSTQPEVASYYLDRASAHLEEMTELDTAVGNRYGLARTKLLKLLLRAASDAVDPAAWTSLAEEMGRDGYHFEERL